MKYPAILILAFLGVVAVLPVSADTLTVSASANTWILNDPFNTFSVDENFSTDSHGLGSGVNSHGGPMRAMFKFDVSQIPANATISSVTVTVTEIKENSGTDMTYELHRILEPWTASEATWNSRVAGTPWQTAGLGSDSDYNSTISSTIFAPVTFSEPVSYTFASSTALIADVQAWVTDPSSNNGWFFKPESEASQNGRRWGSTVVGNAPSLTVIYTAASTQPQQPTISNVSAGNQQVQFSFSAEANRSYTVETRPAFDASTWTPLTTFDASSTPTNHLVTDAISQVSKFYRVKTP